MNNMSDIGINKNMHLHPDLFDTEKLESVPTRNGYGEGLVEAGKRDENVVVLCADLTESTRSQGFKDAYPDRFVQMGVSEQALASIGAGMALAGKVPFISSYAAFSPGRNWEQIKTAAALQGANLKIAGAHAGLSVGPDGATHQMLEDIAIMRALPNMVVEVPCDSLQTKHATMFAAEFNGPFYLRFARAASPVFTTEQTPYTFGKADIYRFGSDLTIVAAGPLVYEALLAAEELSKSHGIEARILNCHTIKPLDERTIVEAAKETGAIVAVEEAQVIGGLAGAVSETLALYNPVPVERIGAQDRFGESGDPREVQEGLGVTAKFITLAAKRVYKRKMGESVPKEPEHIALAKKELQEAQALIMQEALYRTPEKWGGDNPNDSLKSRS